MYKLLAFIFINFKRCPLCAKGFGSGQFLKNHIERRHPNHSISIGEMQNKDESVGLAFGTGMYGNSSTPNIAPEWSHMRDGLLQEIEKLKASERDQRVKMEQTLAKEREVLRQKEVPRFLLAFPTLCRRNWTKHNINNIYGTKKNYVASSLP